MISNAYYESTSISTTEGSYTDDTSFQYERKITEINLENIFNEKDKILEKAAKIINDIIQENKISSINNNLNEIEFNEKDQSFENAAHKFQDSKEYISTLFSLKKIPNISFANYILRINKYLNPEVSSFITCLIYLDNITSIKNFKIKIDENNIYKLFLTAINLAIKFNEDDFNDNIYVAKIGGIKLEELNELELNFLALLNWEISINIETFKKYYEFISSN